MVKTTEKNSKIFDELLNRRDQESPNEEERVYIKRPSFKPYILSQSSGSFFFNLESKEYNA